MRARPDLRLIVITDAALAAPRDLFDVVRAALAGGAPAIQLRMKDEPGRSMVEAAHELRRITNEHNALLFVNDRVDVALLADADGVHLGPDDLPVKSVRAIVPAGFLLGYSTDDPARARQAERDGADYIGCGAVFGTSSKDVGGEAIGVARLDEVARAVDIPVVGIGGIDETNVAQVAQTSAAGVAVIGAVMKAGDPEVAARRLVEAMTR